MTAADTIRAALVAALPSWHVQFGRWTDDADKSRRYAVIKPAGGLPVELVREPQFTVSLIGADGDTATAAGAIAESIVAALRAWRPTGAAVFNLQPAEPAFMATDDGRPTFELAVSALTT
jgi:hypothetical protein